MSLAERVPGHILRPAGRLLGRCEPPALRLKPWAVWPLIALIVIQVAYVAAWFRDKYSGAEPVVLVDFDIFHLVGRLYWQGDLAEAYRMQALVEYQRELIGGVSFMPWTYPPPFDLVVAALALLPAWLAYLLFTLGTLGIYLLVLRAVAREHLAAVIVCLVPVLFVTSFGGQNGFLTGSLLGVFALLSLRDSRLAGVPLGFMIIKPHLAFGVGFYLLVTRRWADLGVTVATAAGVALLSTLLLGPDIWEDFLHGMSESKSFLAAGLYPLQRMISVYAGLWTLGVPPSVALGVHLAVALGALAAVWAITRCEARSGRALAAALVATQLISPYSYDYDLPILGIALALALRTTPSLSSRSLFLPLLALMIFGGLYPLMVTAQADNGGFVEAYLVNNTKPYGLAFVAVVGAASLLLAAMWQAGRSGRASRSWSWVSHAPYRA